MLRSESVCIAVTFTDIIDISKSYYLQKESDKWKGQLIDLMGAINVTLRNKKYYCGWTGLFDTKESSCMFFICIRACVMFVVMA